MIIYKAISKNSGKSYIGQTSKSLEERKVSHKCDSNRKDKSKFYFHNAIRKYGFEDFEWEILEDGIQEDKKLNEREIYWIKKLGTFGKNGYNMTGGGDGVGSGENHPWFGRKCSEEHKRKLSELNKGERNPMYGRCGEKHPRYGKKHSKETRKLMSENYTKRDVSGKNNGMYGKGHLISGEKHGMYGKKHSDEAKRKMKNAAKRRKFREACLYDK